jgi:hypothetical protein
MMEMLKETHAHVPFVRYGSAPIITPQLTKAIFQLLEERKREERVRKK